MNRRGLLITFAALTAGSALKFSGFNFKIENTAQKKSILLGGAGAMYNLNKHLAEVFSVANLNTDVIVETGGSLQGLIAVKRGAIDLAAMTRELSDEEDSAEAHSFLVARGFITIIVHKDSPVRQLTQAQVRSIFSGEITNWKSVRGNDAAIELISRTPGSSTRQFVEDIILTGIEFSANVKELDTTVLVAEAVAANPNAIGYIASKDSAGINQVSFVEIDSIAASQTTVLSNRYPYTQPFYLVMFGEQRGVAFDFIRFALSVEGQAIVVQEGLVSVC